MLEKSQGVQYKYTLNKTNEAISISNNLTSIDHKFLNEMLYIAQQDLNQLIYPVEIKKFIQLIGLPTNRQTHKKIMAIIDRLLTKLINIIEPTEISFNKTTYLASAELKDGIVYFQFSEAIKKLFITINDVDVQGNKTIRPYVSLNLNKINTLTSTYSIAIYELLMSKSFASKEVIIDVNVLMNIICANQYYKKFSRFNDKILKSSIEEINRKLDVKIELLETIKGEDNKTVKKVRFLVDKSNVKQIIVKKQTNKQSINLEQTKNLYQQQTETSTQKANQANQANQKDFSELLNTSSIEVKELYKELIGYGLSKDLATRALKADFEVAMMIKDEILQTKPNILTEGGFGGLFCTKWKHKAGYDKKLANKKHKDKIIQEEKAFKAEQQQQEQQRQDKANNKAQQKQNQASEIYAKLSLEDKKSLVQEIIENSINPNKKYEDEQIINLFNENSKISKLIQWDVVEKLTQHVNYY